MNMNAIDFNNRAAFTTAGKLLLRATRNARVSIQNRRRAGGGPALPPNEEFRLPYHSRCPDHPAAHRREAILSSEIQSAGRFRGTAGILTLMRRSPPRPEPGGRKRGRARLRLDSIGSFSFVGFVGLDCDGHLLAEEAGNPAARCVFLPACVGDDLGERRPALALQHRDDFLALGPSAGGLRLSSGLRTLGGFLGFWRSFCRVRLLGSLALAGRALSALCATFGFPFPLRLLLADRFGTVLLQALENH